MLEKKTFRKQQTHSAITAQQTHPGPEHSEWFSSVLILCLGSLTVQTLCYLINTAHRTHHTHTHAHAHTHHTHTHTHTHTTHTRSHTTHKRTHNTHTSHHTCTRTFAHARTHAHTHTHTQWPLLSSWANKELWFKNFWKEQQQTIKCHSTAVHSSTPKGFSLGHVQWMLTIWNVTFSFFYCI